MEERDKVRQEREFEKSISLGVALQLVLVGVPYLVLIVGIEIAKHNSQILLGVQHME